MLNRHRLNVYGDFKCLLSFVVQTLTFQSIFEGFPEDADHVADKDRFEQSGVGEFMDRAAADTEDSYNIFYEISVCLWYRYFLQFSIILFP